MPNRLAKSNDFQPRTLMSHKRSPSHKGWYGITPVVWSNSSIVVKLDGPTPQLGDHLKVTWSTPIGFSDITSLQTSVKWDRPAAPSQSGEITSASYVPGTATVTIDGRNFGHAPPVTPAGSGGVDQAELGILIRGSNIQYGYAGNNDWYGVRIQKWTQNQIVVELATPPAPGQPVQVTWFPTRQSLMASS